MGVHESLKIPLDTYACNHGLAIYLAHFSLKYLKLRSRSSIITISPVIKGILPANLQILTKLCRDLPEGMNKQFSVGDIFFTMGKTQEGHAHIDPTMRLTLCF